jgi:pimeloyl-ACP methyl ester carboxylesterase
MLVHGFPETWWVFHKVIPILAQTRRVIAVDLPGFGDSDNRPADYTSTFATKTLALLVDELGLGPVHLTGQDIAGAATFRLAANHPELVQTFTAIETALPGFGLEGFGDIYNGGMWHFGVLASPGIPEMLLTGREREFLTDYAYPAMCKTEGAITEQDVDEMVRTYSRARGFRGAHGLYRSTLTEGNELKELAAGRKLAMPVMTVTGSGGDFTYDTMVQVAESVTAVNFPGVGHFVAMEAPQALADALLDFTAAADALRAKAEHGGR